MSQYSRTTKPTADKTIPAGEIFAVDKTEVGLTNGVSAPGWVRRRAIGDTRIVHETLVAMSTPPSDDDFEEDDTQFPDTARTVVISSPTIETLDDDGETWTDESVVTLGVPIGTQIRFVATATATPSEDVLLYKWQKLIAEDTYQSLSTFTVDDDTLVVDTALLDLEGGVLEDGEFNWKVIARSILASATAEEEFDIQLESAVITIGTDVTNDTVFDGALANFSVVATISPAYAYTLSYQWEVSEDAGDNWDELVGETDDELEFEATEAQTGFLYRCQITGTGIAPVEAVTTAAGTLTVNAATTTTTEEVTTTTTIE